MRKAFQSYLFVLFLCADVDHWLKNSLFVFEVGMGILFFHVSEKISLVPEPFVNFGPRKPNFSANIYDLLFGPFIRSFVEVPCQHADLMISFETLFGHYFAKIMTSKEYSISLTIYQQHQNWLKLRMFY